jgi:hypothetical protein
MTDQTGPWLRLASDTGQTVALHRSDWYATENLQKQLQAPLVFYHEPDLVSCLCR